MLEEELNSENPDLGKVNVVRWSFGAATMFHQYCMMFEAEKYSPDLVIFPVNWLWFGQSGAVTRNTFRFLHMSAMAPLSEQFQSDPGNPLKIEGITASDQLVYFMEPHSLCAKGLKINSACPGCLARPTGIRGR